MSKTKDILKILACIIAFVLIMNQWDRIRTLKRHKAQIIQITYSAFEINRLLIAQQRYYNNTALQDSAETWHREQEAKLKEMEK